MAKKVVDQKEAVAEKPVARPKRGAEKETVADKAPTEKSTVKKLPLTERSIKYLKSMIPDVEDKIYEVLERQVEADDKEKYNVCFVSLSEDKDVEPTAENSKEIIKEILFLYHTAPDTNPTGKQMVLEVLDDESGAYLLVMQEI